MNLPNSRQHDVDSDVVIENTIRTWGSLQAPPRYVRNALLNSVAKEEAARSHNPRGYSYRSLEPMFLSGPVPFNGGSLSLFWSLQARVRY